VEVRNLRKTYGHVVAGPERSGQEHHRGLGSFFGFLWSLCYTLWPTK
jgi:hypothetical protein